MGSTLGDAALEHVASCGHCRSRVAAVSQLIDDPAIQSELSALRHPDLSRRRFSSRRGLLVPGLAAAAAIVVMILGHVQPPDGSTAGGAASTTHREPPATGDLTPAIVAPGALASRADSLRWTNVPEADLYRVRVWNSDGTIVWTTDTRATAVALPPMLQADVRYLWEVSARTGWDRWASSKLADVTVRARESR
jgi:hypothetical protein